MRWFPLCVALGAVACSDAQLAARGDSDEKFSGAAPDNSYVSCGALTCAPGFTCEFGACVADVPSPGPVATGADPGRDPLASQRYVFSLDVRARRLARIDSVTLSVRSFVAGLAPMELGVVGSRELTVLLDALDLVEVLDHRHDPPTSAAFATARALSHVALSPSGEHAVLFYDWDDPRAADRQPEPGNINQVSVVFLGEHADGLSEDQERLVNVAVGFLPRDVRFSSDGAYAVIVGRDSLTRIALRSLEQGVARPEGRVELTSGVAEIVVDPAATYALLRTQASNQVDVLSLAGGPSRCLIAPAEVTDLDLASRGRVVALAKTGPDRQLFVADAQTPADPCAAFDLSASVGSAQRLALEPSGDGLVAFDPSPTVERVWRVRLDPLAVSATRLEKAVSALAFAGDGVALVAHQKLPGVPAWDVAVEDPEISVDKSYGFSWLDLSSGEHHLAVSKVPFGSFTFVPAVDGSPAATFVAVLDEAAPALLRVTHEPGFDEREVELAAGPLALGFLPYTSSAYVTQRHPWGRITFVSADGTDLRHVTGFGLLE